MLICEAPGDDNILISRHIVLIRQMLEWMLAYAEDKTSRGLLGNAAMCESFRDFLQIIFNAASRPPSKHL